MSGPGGAQAPETDEDTFVRAEDIVCLASGLEDEATNSLTRGYLAAEGYGARLGHLEPDRTGEADRVGDVPNELWKCAFRIVQCCTVHELRRGTIEKRQSRPVLVYGHAVQLEHLSSGLLLGCMASYTSSDKQSSPVGLLEDHAALQESCWFTVHPVSQQRSDGEKVREGDEVVFLNVANERYMSVCQEVISLRRQSTMPHSDSSSGVVSPTPRQYLVKTSFYKCSWNLEMFRLGSAKEAAIGYANGGDIISLVQQGRPECLSVPLRKCDKVCHAKSSMPNFDVTYSSAREEVKSLWRVELPRLRYGGAFTRWGQPFRLRHVITGYFLCVRADDQGQLTLRPSVKAEAAASLFCFRRCTNRGLPELHEGKGGGTMGEPCVKFGDSSVFLQHWESKKWLGYQLSERSKQGQVPVSATATSKAHLLPDPHPNFSFSVTRATEEQIRATMLIHYSYNIIMEYVTGFLQPSTSASAEPRPLATPHLHHKMQKVLDILFIYFDPSDIKDQQVKTSLIRKRQNLFMKQGTLMLVVSMMDRIFQQEKWSDPNFYDTQQKLYKLLVRMIAGNTGSCTEFATKEWLDKFMHRLTVSPLTDELLDLLCCILEDSPQAIHLVSEKHIVLLVDLLAAKGRDRKVLTFLSSLCVLHGVAIRDKQRNIAQHLLQRKGLFLHTSSQQGVVSYFVKPAYLSKAENSALSRKWYYEVDIKHHHSRHFSRKPLVRVGWAHVELYKPFPSSNGFQVTSGAVGHDLFSVGCDGVSVWVGECRVGEKEQSLRRQNSMDESDGNGYTVGCCVDLDSSAFSFYCNSRLVGKTVILPQLNLMTPTISVSGGISFEVLLGSARTGDLSGPHPPGYTPLSHLNLKQSISLCEYTAIGNLKDNVLEGPTLREPQLGFIPSPIDTSKVIVPDKLLSLRDSLAEHIHDVWSRDKVKGGWQYAETRNNTAKKHPCLKSYAELSEAEKRYDFNLAFETLATLIGLGYEVAFDTEKNVVYQELDPTHNPQPNGYLPRPLDLSAISLPHTIAPLIERMAENIHNVWAADRIGEGWTYGVSEEPSLKQNPAMVPYHILDEKLKDSNRCTAVESIKSLYAFGARLIPPDEVDHGDIRSFALESTLLSHNLKKKTIRGQNVYAGKLATGKWYFEVRILTPGSVRVGWVRPTMHPNVGLGEDEDSFAFDGCLGRKLHVSSVPFGHPWEVGDIIGCLLDSDAKTMCFSIKSGSANSVIMCDTFGDPIAFAEFEMEGGFVPGVTLGPDQKVEINFGRDKPTHLQELERYGFGPTQGYVPVCRDMFQKIPLWFSCDAPQPHTLEGDTHPRLTLSRHDKGYFQVTVKGEESNRPQVECLRLSTYVTLRTASRVRRPKRSAFSPEPLLPSAASTPKPKLSSHPEVPLPPTKVSYTVHIPSEQDPRCVLIGWTAPDFTFSPLCVASVMAAVAPDSDQLDQTCFDQSVRVESGDGSRVVYSSCVMVPLLHLLEETCTSMLVEVTCSVDCDKREVEYMVDGKVVRTLPMQLQTDVKLYPTVLISPTPDKEHLLSFVVDEAQVSEAGYKYVDVVAMETSFWARSPSTDCSSTKDTGRLAKSCLKTGTCVSALVPWEDRVFPLRDICEDKCLTQFHVAALKLCCSLCTHSYGDSLVVRQVQLVLGREQLLHVLQVEGLPYQLRATCIDLAQVLMLQEVVLSRLSTKCENVVSLPSKKGQQDGCPEAKGWQLCWGEGKEKEMQKQELSPVYHQEFSLEGQEGDCLFRLKNIAFRSLSKLLHAGEAKCSFMSQQDRTNLLKPLIEVCDHLLVAGVINKKDELQFLLSLLSPTTFQTPPGYDRVPCGIVATRLHLEEPIKLAICRLLQHICDCQVQKRVQFVVAFSDMFVGKLKKDQEQRYAGGEGRRRREFMSTPEQQVDFLLTPNFESRAGQEGGEQTSLDELEQFHSMLCEHSGVSVLEEGEGQSEDEEGLRARLKQLYDVLVKRHQVHKDNTEAPCVEEVKEVPQLRKFVTDLMMTWAMTKMAEPQLVKEVYSLLYRQYNGAHEVAKALQRSYVVPLLDDHSPDVDHLLEAVGSLRGLLLVGMGQEEESKLKYSLKRILRCRLFKDNPDLMRFLRVHQTALSLLKDYLGVSEVKGKGWKKKTIRKKSASIQGKVSEPVQACCDFLHSFTSVSQQNQVAMFEHLDFMLKCAEQHPELLGCAGHSPLDVATETFRSNDELVIFLRESHLESVVKLLSQQFISQSVQTASLTTSDMRSNDVWALSGADKCLDFLVNAVWCKDKYIKSNALVVIRLLLRYSECLNPIISNPAGLSILFHSATTAMPNRSSSNSFSERFDSPHPATSADGSDDDDDDDTGSRKSSEYAQYSGIRHPMFGGHRPMSHSSTLASFASEISFNSSLPASGEGATLRFLSHLLRLLGYCAPPLPREVAQRTTDNTTGRKLSLKGKDESAHLEPENMTEDGFRESSTLESIEVSIVQQTHSLLRSLIDREDILGVLSLPLADQDWEVFNSSHKEACLLFFDRVYSIDTADKLLQFIDDVATNDIKFAIECSKCGNNENLYAVLEYITSHLLPVMSTRHHLVKKMDTDEAKDTLQVFLGVCYQLSVEVSLSPSQRDKVADFLTTFCRALKPRLLVNLMPKLLLGVPQLQPKNIAALKFLTEHFSHFRSYYHIQSGFGVGGYGAASEEEHRFTAAFCFRLLHNLCFEPVQAHVVHYGAKCLRSLVSAVHPGMVVLPTDLASAAMGYQPRKVDVSKIKLNEAQEALVERFCVYLHDLWARDLLDGGWQAGEEYSKEMCTHPELVPFERLPLETKEKKLSAIAFYMKVTLYCGWGVVATRASASALPFLQRTFTLAVPTLHAGGYNPSPLELNVQLSPSLNDMSRRLAKLAHEQWSCDLMQTDLEFQRHPDFKAFENLDDDVRQEKSQLPLDLLRFIVQSGFDVVRNRSQTWTKGEMVSAEGGTRFATEFFSKLLSILATPSDEFPACKMKMVATVVLPLLTQFLSTNAILYHSASSDKMEDIPREEKSLIIKLLPQMWSVCQQNYQLLCIRRTPAKCRNTELNISTALQSFTALTKSLSLKDFPAEAEETQVLQEFLDGSFHELDNAKSLDPKDPSAVPTLDFTFRVVIPSLTAFFKSLTRRRNAKAAQAFMSGTTMRIFQCLCEFARNGLTRYSFIESDVHVYVGRCLGTIVLAHPSRLLDASDDSLGVSLPDLTAEVERAGKAGKECSDTYYIVDIVLPLLCSYLEKHWIGPLSTSNQATSSSALASTDQFSSTVVHTVHLIWSHFGEEDVPWMYRAVNTIRSLLPKCSFAVLTSTLLPMGEELQGHALRLWQDEVHIHMNWETSSSAFGAHLQALMAQYGCLTRDLLVFCSLLVTFLSSDQHKASLSTASPGTLTRLFSAVEKIYHTWFTSPHFKREFLSQQTLFLQSFPDFFDHLTDVNITGVTTPTTLLGEADLTVAVKRTTKNVLEWCVRDLLGLRRQLLSRSEEGILNECSRLSKEKVQDNQWLRVKVLGDLKAETSVDATEARRTVQRGTADRTSSSTVDETATLIVGLVKLEHRLRESECPVSHQSQSRWKKIKVLTDKRRKAIVSCFMAVPFFKLPVHRAMNLFLRSYPKIWLENMQRNSHLALRETFVTSTKVPNMVHPLTQLMNTFTQEAVSGSIPAEMFSDYMTLLTLFCNVFTAEDEMDEEDPTKNYKKFAELRASLHDNQSHLCEHGAAVMLLQVLASTGGQQPGPVVQMCLHLGVALLKGGNETVQRVMLEKLRKMDAEVLKCIEALILGCSVLHWDGHESAGRSSLESHAMQGSLPDYHFIWSLFRFLQLLCEEHYEDFQDYLRTQDSNSTSIDIVCCTVDYLLRLQESLSDYCWYLTEDGVVGTHRREALNRGLSLAKQVMRTLTEYIQGPCRGNQRALAASRLWDATPGFLKLFASLQWKLGKDTTHIELMLDLMKVQKSLFTLLQSMLEGVETNDPTAQKMANMFIEDAQAVEDIMKFFCMFLELKDLVTAQAFREYDQNGDGWISRSEFQSAMSNLTSYSREEIDYMMDCADLDRDGRLDYMEFTHRFHTPAEQIGFCLCVLITTLSDHLPGERRLERFRDTQSSIFKYFDKSLGRIEIVGKRGKVERVYFEIKPWWMEQWMERQVQESKKEFLQGLDVRSQREKLGAFISFCEDTIFEIRHAAKINEIESVEEIRKAEAHMKQYFNTRKKPVAPSGTPVKASEWTFSSAGLSLLMFLLHYLWLAKNWLGAHVGRKTAAVWGHFRKTVEPQPRPPVGEPPQKHDHHSVDPAPPSRGSSPLPAPATPDISVHESEVTDTLSNPPSKLELNYDRSKLGSPVDATSTATGGPVSKVDSTQALSVWALPNISTTHQLVSWSSRLARNYYHLHLALLVVTVLVNLWLMSFRIPGQTDEYRVPAATLGSVGLFILSVLHVCVTGLVLLSYYHLKVPVLLFKHEKNITHKLKVSKTWVQKPPRTNKERWDSLVLRSPSFPRLAIDVQLKDKLVEEHGPAAAHVLGMEERKVSHKSTWSASCDIIRRIFDDYVRYELWSVGVMATDWALLFRVLCFVASVLGLLCNPFFFSLHLLDLVWSSTSLQNVLKSVMLNYKQMMVTIGMTCVVVYLYTVIAFNLFQKYYTQAAAENPVPHCDSMLKCFFYHLNHGLRSGGGIADVIRSAAGDDQEGMRLIFDMTFFFFVIVILLAIIEGLITDSFGKLRNKEEALKEDMQTRCFICGLQKEKLEDIPHGFDQHTGKEHHMAHYMFFLMHLIKKPETEFTGQESHVWDQYCGQKWDFFPVAESFRLRKNVKPATS